MRSVLWKVICFSLVAMMCGAMSGFAVPMLWNVNGHYYELALAEGINWVDANAIAQSKNYNGWSGYLATVTSAEENSFICDNLILPVIVPGVDAVWAGGFQNPITTTDPAANWTWVNGEGSFPGNNQGPIYANWNVNEPNDAYGQASEQYLAIGVYGYLWNDEADLSHIHGYVVEYGPVGVPDQGNLVIPFALMVLSFVLIHYCTRKVNTVTFFT
jgi:hypothetical protein